MWDYRLTSQKKSAFQSNRVRRALYALHFDIFWGDFYDKMGQSVWRKCEVMRGVSAGIIGISMMIFQQKATE